MRGFAKETEIQKKAEEVISCNTKKAWEIYEREGRIYSYTGAVFATTEDGIRDVKYNPYLIFTLGETVDVTRLNNAVDYAVKQCPYVNYEIIKEGPGLIQFRESDLPLPVVKAGEVKKYGTKENNYSYSMVAYLDNSIHIGICHVITDGMGIAVFVNELFKAYFGVAAEDDVIPIVKNEDYLADILAKSLPLPDNYAPFSTDTETKFVLPEIGEEAKYFSKKFTVPAYKLYNFADALSLNMQGTISLVMALMVQKVHPENDKPIYVRGPVNTRSAFNIPHTFQNASFPHIYLSIDPHVLAAGNKEYLSRDLREQFERQYNYENIAYVVNRFYMEMRGEDDKFFGEYYRETGLFASYMGDMTKNCPKHQIIDIEECNDALFPLMLYFFVLGDDMVIQCLQSFDSDVYFKALKEVINELEKLL